MPGGPELLHPGLGLQRSGQLGHVEAATSPGDRLVVRGIREAEVGERDEEVFADAGAHVGPEGHVIVEQAGHVTAIGALRCSRQAQQKRRGEVGEYAAIGGSVCVVDLVHDDVVEPILCEGRQRGGAREGLDRGEQHVEGLFGADAAQHPGEARVREPPP